MKKYLIWTSVLLFSIDSLTAQTVDLKLKGKLNRAKASTSFEFVKSTTDLPSSNFIGTLKAIGVDKDSSIPKLFFKLKNKAQELGANCFKLNKFEKRDNLKKASLLLDIYFCGDSVLQANRANHLKNSAILFLDDFNSDEVYEFYINEIKRKVNSGTYFRYNIKTGADLLIAQSGLIGSTIKYKWIENRPAIFITFTDFGLENKDNESDYLGMYFNTKRINRIDSDLGYLLTLLLDKL